MKISRLYLALFVVAAFCFSACGDENTEGTDNAASDSTMTMEAAPSMEAQIGPVTELELGAYDAVLAATGEAAFTAKCTACHNLDTKVLAQLLAAYWIVVHLFTSST